MDWKRFGFIALVIIVLFSVVVMIGQSKQPPLLIITSMLATTIAVATPLALGALSGVFCERAGVVNIGIEGMMLTAAFFGIAHFYGAPGGYLGVLATGFFGWILGRSILETKGLFWPWFIHLWADVVIFGFMAIGALQIAS